MFEYYLKIRHSCFDSGFTIPKDYEECFIQNEDIPVSSSREIKLVYKNKEYNARIQNGKTYYALRFSKKFINKLKEEFIYSYVRFKEDDLQNVKINKEYHYNEVLKIKAVDPFQFELETFIKQETEFKYLFSRLIKEDFFGWLESGEKDQLIVSSSEWFDKSELFSPPHKDSINVIYYLIDETKKEIYIGSTDKLVERFRNEREEIPGWNKFRYDTIKPKYKHLKQRIENQIINAFAMMLDSNIKNKNPINISTYKLTNKICYN